MAHRKDATAAAPQTGFRRISSFRDFPAGGMAVAEWECLECGFSFATDLPDSCPRCARGSRRRVHRTPADVVEHAYRREAGSHQPQLFV